MFEYTELPKQTRDDVETEIAAIRGNETRILRLRITNGQHLLNIKRLIGHGGWLKWLLDSQKTGYRSERTAQKDMALAEVLYERLDELDSLLQEKTTATALEQVTREYAHADALEAALELMRRGLTIRVEDAKMLNFILQFNPKMGENVRSGEIGIQEAYAVAQRLEALNVPESVEDVVVRGMVNKPDMVDALVIMQKEQPERFEEVAASLSIFNVAAGIEVPLSEASVGDAVGAIEYEESERIAQQKAHFQEWKKHRAERIASLEGSIYEVLESLDNVLRQHGKDKRYKVYVYPAEEQREGII